MTDQIISAEEALLRLKEGNKKYLNAETGSGDISPAIRLKTAKNGQHPYAIIVTCSDSRVIPEEIFSAGIGELFVVRVAGNVIDRHQLGSIEYAADHLGCALAVVLGHTDCGAVNAALNSGGGGYVRFLTDKIISAIGGERDPYKACVMNVEHSVKIIEESLERLTDKEVGTLRVTGAVYHVDTGEAEFL